MRTRPHPVDRYGGSMHIMIVHILQISPVEPCAN